MPVTNWSTTTIDGKQWLIIECTQFRIPLDWDPSSHFFFAVAAPNGGVGGLSPFAQGDPGDTPTIETAIELTALEFDDITADSADWLITAPDTYKLQLTLHKGAPGNSGTFQILDATDLTGTPLASKMLVVNADANGIEFASQKVGDRYVPASLASAPSGNPAYTLGSVMIPAQPFDWRPECKGVCIVTGTGVDIRADLVARLGNETAGNIVARGIGQPGQNPPLHSLCSMPPPGSADGFDRVAQGAAATIFLRVERQSGTATFTTDSATTLFGVRPMAIPS